MKTAKIILVAGVDHNNQTHYECEIRPSIISDDLRIEEWEAQGLSKYDTLLNIMSLYIVRIGTVSKAHITPALIATMAAADVKAIIDRKEEFELSLKTFRKRRKNLAHDGAETHGDGDTIPGSDDDAPLAGDDVA